MKENTERRIKNKKIMIALMEYIVTLGCLLVVFVMISGKKIEQTSSYAKPEEVSKYKVINDEYLTRVRPLTEYSAFKEIAENTLKRNIEVYKNATKEEIVLDGYIESGMVVEVEEEDEMYIPTDEHKTYEIRVLGDFNVTGHGDGDCNVEELTRMIRHVVELERLKNKGEELSADFNEDGEIDVVDITKCIRYIVYDELEADKEEEEEPKAPEAPEIKVINPEEEKEWYNSDVELRIIEKAGEEGEIEKTETDIEKDGEIKETTEEKEIELTEEGEYKITAQSYGVNGLKSEKAEKGIRIDKTAPELEISREDIDRTKCKIKIEARDNGGIIKYTITREGEEERSKEGIDEKEIKGYVTIRENGTYKVTVEDHAGNKVEKEIEITDLNNRYTVIFKNEDENIITQRDYEEGENIEVPQNPTKGEDNTYTYEFAGWKTTDRDGQEIIVTPEEITSETVTENKEYIATYTSAIKNYTVIFKDEDGREILKRTDYHYGDTVEIPENPTKAEDETNTYRFIGWDKEVSTEVVGNVEYKAVYETTRKEYTIIFRDAAKSESEEGKVLSEKTDYHYGEKVAIPQNPTKGEDNTYTYEFAGWKTTNEEGQEIPQTKEEIANTEVTKEIEYVATYEATKINYNLVFYNDDYNEETGEGTVIERRTYNYGDIINFPEATKEETEEIRYVFDSWKNLGTREISEAEIDIEFKAEYREEYYVARIEPVTQIVTTTNEETGETVKEEQVVLEGKSYLTLKEAIEEAGRAERTIRMLKDTEESVTIEDDQNITINLNGKTITAKKTYVIKTYGELTIVNNSSDEGKILEISEEDIGYGIYNRDGKVTIKSGTIAAETSKENGGTYAIYNQSESPLVVTGGSVIAEAKGANSIGAGIYNLAGKEIDITGGLVYGNAIGEGTTTYGIYNETDGKVDVEGGMIQAKASHASGVSYGIYNKVSQEVVFNGGQIIVQSDKNKAYGIYNEEGKVTLGEISEEEHKGTINVTASEGYGVYNDRGTIEEKTVTITTTGSITYGMYNNQGIITTNNGIIELTSTTAYGIYNKNEATITGMTINNKNNGRNTFGIYNEANKDINIQNVIITGGQYGVFSSVGNITLNEVNIESAEGIYTSNNNPTIIVEKANIEATSHGIDNIAGTVILKDVIINSDNYGVFTTNSANTEIGIKDNAVDMEKPYIYGKTYAVYVTPSSQGNIKFYDGTLQGQNVIYGGVSDIENNSQIKIEAIENEGRTEEVAILQVIEERNVAKIGQIEYTTLADAVAAVPANQEQPTTIEILADSDISNVVEIPENKNVVIDLKGHTLTTYAKGGIINKGTLEIIDTKEENNEQQEPTQGNTTMKALKESTLNKTLKLAENETGEGSAEGQATIGTIESKVGMGITNEGTLLLTGGKIVYNNDGIYNINNGQVTVQGATIVSQSIGIRNDSSNNNTEINVISGTISSKYKGISSYRGNVNISGGEIEGENTGVSGSYGTLNMTGGTIKSQSTGISVFNTINIIGGNVKVANGSGIRSDSKIEISGGKIEAMQSGIMSLVGTINVTGGEIISESYAITSGSSLGRGATIILGDKESDYSNNPVIIGKEYGVYESTKSTCRIEYYNGIVKGKEDAIYGSIADIRDGKELSVNTEIIDGEEYKVTSLVDETDYSEPIAQIGEKTYTKISELKDDILLISTNQEDATEVNILNDFTLLETLEIKSGQKVLIDLNGKTITCSSAIFNQGELEITDTTEEHLGKIKDTKITAIKSTGATTITKGTTEGEKYAIVPFNNSTVTIGTKDGEVDENQVLINSHTGYGIYGGTYTIKMYDGKITELKENVYTSYINDIEEGYKVVTNKVDGMNVTTLQLEDPVAKIGETEYYGLQTAIDECENGQTIELIRTIEKQNHTLTIPEGKEIKLDLKGYTINSNLDKTLINNGTLTIENSSGTIENTKADGVTVENNGVFNLNKGTLSESGTQGKAVINNGTINVNGGTISETTTLGTAIENKGILNIFGGVVSGNTYAIENLEAGKINMTSGTVTSTNYGIYNESTEDIDITGGTIQFQYTTSNNSLYGIFNNVDAKVSLKNASIESNIDYLSGEKYVYGIYNEANGEVVIGEGGKIKTGRFLYNTGIYNNGNGNVTTEGTISVNGQYLAYGIRNSGQGEVKVTGGDITLTSSEGTAYGIENGAFGGLEITGGSIAANTTSGTSYGINSISTKTIKVKEGTITATGEESYGIYSNSADIEIGENDGEIKTTPVIEGDKEGLHVNTTDTKFKFYDGKIIGKPATYVEANIPEDAKIIRYYNEETQIETLTLMEKNTYIITFYNEDRTQIIEQKLFKSTDTEIEEPSIPEKAGYIGYWSDYEIGEHDIETHICYTLHRENGTMLVATDEYGLTWNYTYQDGEATDVYYESGDIEALDGIVNIPGRLDGYPVVMLFSNKYERCIFFKSNKGYAVNTTVKQLKIPSSVTNIGDYAFYKCSGLTNIEIPNSVTSIGRRAFSTCTGLTSVEIPNSVITIGEGSFEYSSGLKRLTIPYQFGVDDLNKNRFFGTGSFEEIILTGEGIIPSYDYSVYNSGKRRYAYEFTIWRQHDVDKIVISNGITGIGNYVFYEGKEKSVEIPSSVTSIGNYAFLGCTGLTEVNMPNVTSIGYCAFVGCTGLTSIEIPSGVTSIGDEAFSGCTGLTSIEIPSGVTSIGDAAFSGCIGLTEIEIPNSVTSIGRRAFSTCRGLTSIEIPSGVTSIEYGAFSGCTGLTSIETPSGVTSIGDYAFSGCPGLTSIEIPSSVTSIGNAAFCYWTNEQTIYIEAESKPDGWINTWNKYCNANIVWGYKGDTSD